MSIDLKGEMSLGPDTAPERVKAAIHKRISRLMTMPKSCVIDANTYNFLAFDSPTPNEIWEVLEVAVEPQDPFIALAAGQFLVAVMTNTPQNSNVELPTFQRITGVPIILPNVLEKARRSLVLQTMERIVVVMKSVPQNTNIQAFLSVIVHDKETYLSKLES
jgi:hypothetical protein